MTPAPPRDPRVDATIAELAPAPRAVAQALRKLVNTGAPTLRETLLWGNPVWIGRGKVICLMLFPHHVNLGFFFGAQLSSKYRELEGTGKGMRHVKVPTVNEARNPVLARIIRDAVKLDAATT
jgi:hypothetical protein